MEGHKTYSWQGRWFKDIGLLSLGPKSYLRTPSLKPLNEQFTQISPKSFFFGKLVKFSVEEAYGYA